jgi:hypothetical protein
LLYGAKAKQDIGFGYKNLLLVAHKILDSDKVFGKLLLYAMHQYGRYDSIIKEDKSGKLIKKNTGSCTRKAGRKRLSVDYENIHRVERFQAVVILYSNKM